MDGLCSPADGSGEQVGDVEVRLRAGRLADADRLVSKLRSRGKNERYLDKVRRSDAQAGMLEGC